MTITATTQERAPITVGMAGVAGSLLIITPLLVEFVVGEFILLLPIALLLAIAAGIGILRFRKRAGDAVEFPKLGVWLFVGGLTAAIASEVFEQSLQGPIPTIADVLPPTLFIVSGVGLLMLARAINRSH